MEIRFGSPDLAKVCNCSASIDRRWGKQVAEAIRERLHLLGGIPTLELLREFPGLMTEPIKLDQDGRFAIAVIADWRFFIRPDHEPVPYLRNRGLDCKSVKKIVIVEVHCDGR
jgi:plasmid maintenance system killer protein